jgi:Sap, sulfolipid-1-addressing protein
VTGLLGLVFYGLAAAAAAPVAAVVTAFILGKSARPLPSAFAFVGGALILDLAFSLIVLLILGPSIQGGGDIGAYIDVALGAIFLILGVQAVFEHDTPDQQAAQRARVERLATARLVTMIGAGVVVQIINIDALAVMAGGLKEILEATLSDSESTVALIILLALMLLPYWAPAAAFAISPTRTRPALQKMTEWVLANARMVEIVTGFGFGAIFALKGVSALLA